MRIHLVTPPHTETIRECHHCPFTTKARRFATMMTSLGYDVRLYAGERNDASVTEHVTIVNRKEQAQWFERYDWDRDVFTGWDPGLPWWRTMNERAAREIRKRCSPGDILALPAGTSQGPLAQLLVDQQLFIVEIGIGYEGSWAPHRVFSSHAHQHVTQAKSGQTEVRFFDTVIPNSFDVVDFPPGKGDGGYFLFFGRVTHQKGPLIAAETCRVLGAKLVVVGQGVRSDHPVRTLEGTELPGEVEYRGVVGPDERAEIMGGARALFTPTLFPEPFGNTSIEAMLCGTPVISTDWGAYTENNVHGLTGYRCRTLQEFVTAARKVGELDRAAIRQYAIDHFSMDVVRHQYDHYFRQLATLRGKGWYALDEEERG